MPLRVFPVADNPGASPAFSDGFQGPGRHEGIDVFVPVGTPILAPDDGELLYVADGRPCTNASIDPKPPPYSYHLTAQDGAFYYGTHLLTYPNGPGDEGTRRQVKAGDVISWVGNGGNACDRPPHLHFEKHVNGEPVDPFGELQAAEHRPNATPPPAQASPTPATTSPLTLAAKAILAAYSTRHPGVAQADAVALCRIPFAQALGESLLAPTFLGTNNWGAMQAGEAFWRAHRQQRGFGVIAHRDTDPRSGPYIGQFICLPSPIEGALAFLALVEQDVGPLAALHQGSLLEDLFLYATKLYEANYFVGGHKDVTPLANRRAAFAEGSETADDDRNVSDYVRLIEGRLARVDGAFASVASETGDPTAVTLGPPFAPLVDRLTPNDPPHTIEHAREVFARTRLGTTVDACLAPDAGGEGVWLFGTGKAVHEPPPVPASSSSSSSAWGTVLEVAAAVGGLAAATYGAWKGGEAALAWIAARRHA